MADYIYSVSGDFPNHQVDLQSLHQEILDESTITKTLDGVNVTGDVCKIVFLQSLTSPEETALDNVVAAHDGTAIIYIDPVLTHINAIGNPHGTTAEEMGASPTVHTHVEADITDLDHDAQKIKGKDVDDSAIADGKVLSYKSSSDKVEYVDSASGGVDIYNNGTIVSGGPFGNQNFINFSMNKWYNASWLYRKKITIDYTKVGGNLVNFPVLIDISSDSDLSSHARSDGYDILFTSANGATKLNHERISYSTGTLRAWVKVLSLSSTKNTVIYMYYGNSGASDQQNIEGTWDNGHAAVWHFENSFLDSTLNNNDGTNDGTSDIAGKLGRARSFDGNNDRINLGTGSVVNSLNPFTISAWVYVDTTPSTDRQYGIYSKANDYPSESNAFTFLVGQYPTSDRYLVLATNDGSWHDHVSTSQVPLTTWTFVSVIFNGSSYIFYMNTSQVGSGIYTPPGSNASLNQHIGDSQTAHYFDGRIDELRISSVARSSGWLTTSYNNQNSPATFISLGSEESDQSIISIEGLQSVFGSKFATANSLSESSTTGSTWLNKVSAIATDLPTGKYKIGWYAEIRKSSTSNSIEARVLVNGSSEKALTIIEPNNTNNYIPFGGVAFHDVVLESNTIVADLQWRDVGYGTSYIRNARVEIYRN